MTHISSGLGLYTIKIPIPIFKIKDCNACGRHFEKIEKLPYLSNGLTDRHELLHDDAN